MTETNDFQMFPESKNRKMFFHGSKLYLYLKFVQNVRFSLETQFFVKTAFWQCSEQF